jgi:hypothetical protein
MERIIYIIHYLAEQNLAFRESAHRLYESCNGNVLKMVEIIAKFDPVMAEHAQLIQKTPDSMPLYLGEKFQNEIILAVARKIKAGHSGRAVFARLNTGIVGSNPARGMDVCLRLFCVCVVLCRYRPCDGLITRSRSPTNHLDYGTS